MGKSENQRYAVAGGPSSGKTTLVNELAKLGYKVYPEAVRILLEQEIVDGRKPEETQGTVELQKKIYALQLEMENFAPQNCRPAPRPPIASKSSYLKSLKIEHLCFRGFASMYSSR